MSPVSQSHVSQDVTEMPDGIVSKVKQKKRLKKLFCVFGELRGPGCSSQQHPQLANLCPARKCSSGVFWSACSSGRVPDATEMPLFNSEALWTSLVTCSILCETRTTVRPMSLCSCRIVFSTSLVDAWPEQSVLSVRGLKAPEIL